jgi:outer membrane protein TolC
MKKLLLILTGLLFTAAVFAQQNTTNAPVYNFSLADCINYAYQHQDTVLNAGLDVKSAEYKVKETTGIGLPQINGSASFQDYLKSPTTIFPDFITPLTYGVLVKEGVKDGNGNPIKMPAIAGGIPVSFYQKYTSNLGVTLNQLIFDGSYLVGLRASRTYKELSQKNFARSKVEANVQVTKAYYQVLVSNERINLLNANITQLKQQLDQTTAQNRQGFVEKIDVDRLSVQYNDLVTTRDNTIRLLALNYELLKFQMGMPVGEHLVLTDKLEDVKLEDISLGEVSDTSSYHNRIEYGLVETQLKLNQLDLARRKAAYLPSLSANGNTSVLFQNNSFNQLFKTDYPATYVGLTLNVPIFSGFQRVNQVKQAKIAVLKTQNDLENIKNGLNLQADAARISYYNGLQSLNNQKKSREVAQEVLRVSKIKYQQGVGSSIEVTQAETALADADDKYIQGLYQALISKVDLDRAYGRIQ